MATTATATPEAATSATAKASTLGLFQSLRRRDLLCLNAILIHDSNHHAGFAARLFYFQEGVLVIHLLLTVSAKVEVGTHRALITYTLNRVDPTPIARY